jgi:hypothetical protein
MEIDARIVFTLSPATTGTANGMVPGLCICDMRTMGDLLAELAGDTTPNALHNDVRDACNAIEWFLDLDDSIDRLAA